MRTYDLSPLFRSSVGFDRLSRLIEASQATEAVSYPPYNIEKLGENSYRVTLAVAGFGEGDIDITVENNDFHGSFLGIHTGHYGSTATGSVYSIMMSNNYIYSLLDGTASLAIQMGVVGQKSAIKDIDISNTLLCNAGAIEVQPGTGNSLTGTATTTACG